MINIHIQFEVYNSTRYANGKGRRRKVHKMRWFGVLRSHSRSL